MKTGLKKSAIYSLIVAVAFGLINSLVSLGLDWRLKSQNPANYEALVELGVVSPIFSWGRVLIFSLEVFVIVFIVFFVAYIIKAKGKT